MNIATVLSDLQRAGVTDVLLDTSFDFYSNSLKPAPIKVKTAVPAAIATPEPIAKATARVVEDVVKAKPQAKLVAPQLIGNPAAVVVALHSQGATIETAEQELLTNMLKAIGLKFSEVALIGLPETDVTRAVELQTAVAELANNCGAKHVLALGQGAAVACGAEAKPLRELRTTAQKLATAKMQVTYSLAALLQHSDMKKLAWIDLQAFQAKLTSV